MVTISVLGPVAVRRRGGESVPVPAGKTSELLVRLALEAGGFVRADRLVDDLWAEAAVRTRRNTLQSKVARLRRALGDPELIVSADGGYQLAVDPADVDALVVVSDALHASRALDAGDARRAADLCTTVLAMFEAEVLPGVDGEWVTPHRARIEEARISLVETLLAARLQLGDTGDVIGELEAAVAQFPFQESLWALLITALYRGGRQADALAAYQRVRDRLADELGLDPGPSLRQLEQQVLRHDPALDVRPDIARVPPAYAGNLPSMTAELVGRDLDVATLSHLLVANRLVEVVGPGGVGKTALAIATARTVDKPGGVWLVRLEAATNADDVIDTVLAALAVAGGEAALHERLRLVESLVILDNCEHVLDAAAEIAVRMLDTGPGVRVLCTSQVALGVDAETVFELAPLALDAAVELFTQRATSQRQQQSSPDGDEAVHDLCRSLDGLPLAIELAAARTKTLSVTEITRRLDDRFVVLSDPTSRRPERRRALKATIGWSYDLLFPDDQRGLWALATFAGGATLPAVEFVLEALDVPAPATIDVVSRLAARSLVIVDDEPSSQPSPGPRFRLLDSIRAFAAEAMAESERSESARAAHAMWYAAKAETSTGGVRSSHQAEHLAFARTERANIDTALAWCAVHDPRQALSIVNGFGWAWVVLGDSRGAQRIAVVLEAVGDTAPAPDRIAALLLLGWIEASTGHIDLARLHVDHATRLADEIGDADLQARCCYYLAYVVSHHGDFRHGLELTDRSQSLYAELDRPWDLAANGLFAARAAISAGDRVRSTESAAQVQQWLRVVDDPWLHVRCEGMLGELARLELRFDDAVDHFGRATETSHRLGFLQTEAYQVACLGRAQCQAGNYDDGVVTLQSAIDKAEATGDMRMAALARVHLGRALRAVGRTAQARAVLEATNSWHRAAGGGEQALLGECLLAAIDADAGSVARLAQLLETARLKDDAPVEVFALDSLARVAAQAGDPSRAAALITEADARMQVAAHFISDRDRVDAHAARQLSSLSR